MTGADEPGFAVSEYFNPPQSTYSNETHVVSDFKKAARKHAPRCCPGELSWSASFQIADEPSGVRPDFRSRESDLGNLLAFCECGFVICRVAIQ
jgi:hypothetical protein